MEKPQISNLDLSLKLTIYLLCDLRYAISLPDAQFS